MMKDLANKAHSVSGRSIKEQRLKAVLIFRMSQEIAGLVL